MCEVLFISVGGSSVCLLVSVVGLLPSQEGVSYCILNTSKMLKITITYLTVYFFKASF